MTVGSDGLQLGQLGYRAVNGSFVLRDVTLCAKPGEIIGVLGPSGAGKSTLFRLIAGLLQPTHGSIRLEGSDVLRQPACQRPISFLQQDYPLYRRLSVIDNTMIAFEALETGKSQARDFAGDMLEAVGVETAYWHRFPDSLSGGEMQRVALAKALLKPCRILLLDEPMSNVDKARKTSLNALLSKVVRDRDLIALYVSHDEQELLLTTDRLAVIEDGRLIQVGCYPEMVSAPASGTVAAIGSAVGLQTLPRRAFEFLARTLLNPIDLPSEYFAIGWQPDSGRLVVQEGKCEVRLNALSFGVEVEKAVRVGEIVYWGLHATIAGTRYSMWHVSNVTSEISAGADFDGQPTRLEVDLNSLICLDGFGNVIHRNGQAQGVKT